MKTAMMSVVPLGDAIAGGGSSSAVESAVDAYATRVLEKGSPPDTFVDSSLGPYVTALLRCSAIQSEEGVASMPEFDSLVELLEDQCNMRREDAESALRTIARAVCTGRVPHEPVKGGSRVGPYAAGGLDSFRMLGKALEESVENFASDETMQNRMEQYPSSSTGGPSPLKPDNLIPIDLLGALDDFSPASDKNAKKTAVEPQVQHDEAFPPLGAKVSAPSKKGVRGKKGPKTQSKDLAAALFRPARPRQNSIEKEEVLNSQANAPQPSAEVHTSRVADQYSQHQLDSAVEILLSMNTGLSEEAATVAALMANADFNIAQYIVDVALSAPPVCRHMLHEGCYRSDCQFSHDVEGHTCIFWIRGRCGKGSSCKFLHGFNQNLLESIQSMPHLNMRRNQATYSSTNNSIMGGPTSQQAGFYSSSGSFAPQPPGLSLPSHGFDNQMLASSWNGEPFSGAVFHYQQSTSDGLKSFANIASQGYDQSRSPFATTTATTVNNGSSSANASSDTGASVPTVRIPQDLWNPHENRDASVFHISDPLERYAKVATWVQRDDVIDLHFQSTKTFSTVLSKILPEKLSDFREVWIVTGTGHHVGNKTHQKGGGMLERSVMAWLSGEGYQYAKGRDRNGLGGAVLVMQ